MFELGQRLARVVHVGVRHRRVFAHDVHALDLVAMHRVHNLDDGQAALVVERGLPQILKFGANVGVLDRLVIGVDHRDQPGVGGALHVVLAAQRMQPGARAGRPGR